jgi:hypothetical protein
MAGDREDHYAGPWHYQRAEFWERRAAQWAEGSEQRARLTATAQVHATLAQVAAEMQQHLRMPHSLAEEWERALSPRRPERVADREAEAG